MKYFAILGNPVKHSKSPNMHNNLFAKNNINAKYIALSPDNIENLKNIFSQNNLYGANITVPFKEDAFRLCDEVVGLAKKAQAVNTIIKKDDKLIGYNTDGDGFFKSLTNKIDKKDISRALILGAGGSAKSIALVLQNNDIKTTILNRSAKRLDFFKALGFECFCHDDFKMSNYDVVINTTSAGLQDESYPLNKDILNNIFKNTKVAYDIIYNKQTPFLSLAKENNIICENGQYMLIYQGVYASLLFLDNKFTFQESEKLLQEGFLL